MRKRIAEVARGVCLPNIVKVLAVIVAPYIAYFLQFQRVEFTSFR
jgi:hypothetical protein